MTSTANTPLCLYSNNTGTDVSAYHAKIVAAVKNGGVFDSDLADVFSLEKTPEGSACAYVLTWA